MAKPVAERVSANPDREFVVFLIGMRINRLWKIHKWVPPFWAMLRMLVRLRKLPSEQTGCLGTIVATPGLIVQYWRSFEDLEAFAHDAPHQPAWANFNRAVRKARGDVGIWHETYLVRPEDHESLYSGMPLHGLGKAMGIVPAQGRMSTARKRLNKVPTTQETET